MSSPSVINTSSPHQPNPDPDPYRDDDIPSSASSSDDENNGKSSSSIYHHHQQPNLSINTNNANLQRQQQQQQGSPPPSAVSANSIGGGNGGPKMRIRLKVPEHLLRPPLGGGADEEEEEGEEGEEDEDEGSSEIGGGQHHERGSNDDDEGGEEEDGNVSASSSPYAQRQQSLFHRTLAMHRQHSGPGLGLELGTRSGQSSRLSSADLNEGDDDSRKVYESLGGGGGEGEEGMRRGNNTNGNRNGDDNDTSMAIDREQEERDRQEREREAAERLRQLEVEEQERERETKERLKREKEERQRKRREYREKEKREAREKEERERGKGDNTPARGKDGMRNGDAGTEVVDGDDASMAFDSSIGDIHPSSSVDPGPSVTPKHTTAVKSSGGKSKSKSKGNNSNKNNKGKGKERTVGTGDQDEDHPSPHYPYHYPPPFPGSGPPSNPYQHFYPHPPHEGGGMMMIPDGRGGMVPMGPPPPGVTMGMPMRMKGDGEAEEMEIESEMPAPMVPTGSDVPWKRRRKSSKGNADGATKASKSKKPSRSTNGSPAFPNAPNSPGDGSLLNRGSHSPHLHPHHPDSLLPPGFVPPPPPPAGFFAPGVIPMAVQIGVDENGNPVWGYQVAGTGPPGSVPPPPGMAFAPGYPPGYPPPGFFMPGPPGTSGGRRSGSPHVGNASSASSSPRLGLPLPPSATGVEEDIDDSMPDEDQADKNSTRELNDKSNSGGKRKRGDSDSAPTSIAGWGGLHGTTATDSSKTKMNPKSGTIRSKSRSSKAQANRIVPAHDEGSPSPAPQPFYTSAPQFMTMPGVRGSIPMSIPPGGMPITMMPPPHPMMANAGFPPGFGPPHSIPQPSPRTGSRSPHISQSYGIEGDGAPSASNAGSSKKKKKSKTSGSGAGTENVNRSAMIPAEANIVTATPGGMGMPPTSRHPHPHPMMMMMPPHHFGANSNSNGGEQGNEDNDSSIVGLDARGVPSSKKAKSKSKKGRSRDDATEASSITTSSAFLHPGNGGPPMEFTVDERGMPIGGFVLDEAGNAIPGSNPLEPSQPWGSWGPTPGKGWKKGIKNFKSKKALVAEGLAPEDEGRPSKRKRTNRASSVSSEDSSAPSNFFPPGQGGPILHHPLQGVMPPQPHLAQQQSQQASGPPPPPGWTGWGDKRKGPGIPPAVPPSRPFPVHAQGKPPAGGPKPLEKVKKGKKPPPARKWHQVKRGWTNIAGVRIWGGSWMGAPDGPTEDVPTDLEGNATFAFMSSGDPNPATIPIPVSSLSAAHSVPSHIPHTIPPPPISQSTNQQDDARQQMRMHQLQAYNAQQLKIHQEIQAQQEGRLNGPSLMVDGENDQSDQTQRMSTEMMMPMSMHPSMVPPPLPKPKTKKKPSKKKAPANSSRPSPLSDILPGSKVVSPGISGPFASTSSGPNVFLPIETPPPALPSSNSTKEVSGDQDLSRMVPAYSSRTAGLQSSLAHLPPPKFEPNRQGLGHRKSGTSPPKKKTMNINLGGGRNAAFNSNFGNNNQLSVVELGSDMDDGDGDEDDEGEIEQISHPNQAQFRNPSSGGYRRQTPQMMMSVDDDGGEPYTSSFPLPSPAPPVSSKRSSMPTPTPPAPKSSKKSSSSASKKGGTTGLGNTGGGSSKKGGGASKRKSAGQSMTTGEGIGNSSLINEAVSEHQSQPQAV